MTTKLIKTRISKWLGLMWVFITVAIWILSGANYGYENHILAVANCDMWPLNSMPQKFHKNVESMCGLQFSEFYHDLFTIINERERKKNTPQSWTNNLLRTQFSIVRCPFTSRNYINNVTAAAADFIYFHVFSQTFIELWRGRGERSAFCQPKRNWFNGIRERFIKIMQYSYSSCIFRFSRQSLI